MDYSNNKCHIPKRRKHLRAHSQIPVFSQSGRDLGGWAWDFASKIIGESIFHETGPTYE